MLRRGSGFFTSRMIHEKETTIILYFTYWINNGGFCQDNSRRVLTTGSLRELKHIQILK